MLGTVRASVRRVRSQPANLPTSIGVKAIYGEEKPHEPITKQRRPLRRLGKICETRTTYEYTTVQVPELITDLLMSLSVPFGEMHKAEIDTDRYLIGIYSSLN